VPQLNSWDRSTYPSPTDDPDIPDDIRIALLSISGRTVQHFESIAARDAAFATLTSAAQKDGALAHVTNVGLFYYSVAKSVWRYVSANGEYFTQAGVAGVNPDGNGVGRINFPIKFGGIPTVVVNQVHKLLNSPPRQVVGIDTATYPTTPSYFHVSFQQTNGGPFPYYTDVTWIAYGPRGDD
jgi:hypothetical protein